MYYSYIYMYTYVHKHIHTSVFSFSHSNETPDSKPFETRIVFHFTNSYLLQHMFFLLFLPYFWQLSLVFGRLNKIPILQTRTLELIKSRININSSMNFETHVLHPPLPCTHDA